jgi:hypothetical protein
VKRIDGSEIDEIQRFMLAGRLIRKAARSGWKKERRRWKSRTTTARRPICARAGATVSDRRDAPVSPIPTWSHQIRFRQSHDHASPVSKIPRQNAWFSLRPQARGQGSPPIKPEAGPEKTTAGFAVRSLNRSDIPCRLRFMSRLESPGFPGFGFAVHCWTRTPSLDFFALHEWTN